MSTYAAARPASGGGALARQWASGRQLALVERLAFSYRAYAPDIPVFRILPLALDTPVLLNALTRVATGRSTELLQAAKFGLIRLYAAVDVVAEVEEKLVVRATRAGIGEEELRRVWTDELRPLLRVVDTSAVEHPRLAPILARDPLDRPTAVLSLFIGARLTWSSDRDLRDGGYADALRVELIVAAQAVGQFDLTAHFVLNISAAAIEAGARALMRAIDHPGPERTVAIAVIIVTLGVLTVAVLKDSERVKQTAATVAQRGLEALGEASRYRAAKEAALPAFLPPASSEPLPVRIAHALAFAPAPLTASELADVLRDRGQQVTIGEIDAALCAYKMFASGDCGWQLGSW